MIRINLLGTELAQDLISLVRDVLEDERVPLEVKDKGYDRLLRITDRAKVIDENNK